MAKENKVLMCYEAKGNAEILYLGNRIQITRKEISEKHKDDVSLDLSAKKNYKYGSLEFNIRLIGTNPESLEDALNQIFSIIGFPKLFYNGSNYELINKFLENHGKKLKRAFSNFLIGKHIVDKSYSLDDAVNFERSY